MSAACLLGEISSLSVTVFLLLKFLLELFLIFLLHQMDRSHPDERPAKRFKVRNLGDMI